MSFTHNPKRILVILTEEEEAERVSEQTKEENRAFWKRIEDKYGIDFSTSSPYIEPGKRVRGFWADKRTKVKP